LRELGDHDLGLAVRVHVGCVPDGDAGVVGGFEHGDLVQRIEDPYLPAGGAEGHASQDYLGDM
jgi:hypothetical protein